MEKWLEQLHNRPKVKTLEITSKIGCIHSCRWCPQTKIIRAYGKENRFLTFEDFCEILEKLPLDVQIDFSGMSEPTLHPHWLTMVTEVILSGRKASLFTTLSGATSLGCMALEKLPLEHLVIHLPSDRKDEALSCDENLLVKLSHLHFRNNAKNFWYSCDGIPPKEITDIIGEIPESFEVDRAGNLGSKEKEPHFGPIQCAGAGKALNNNVLLPDGRVLLCCNDYSMQHVLGNILTDSYESLEDERSKIRAELEGMMSDTLCRYCHLAIPKQE